MEADIKVTRRSQICGFILKVQGILLLLVGIIHLAVIPLLRSTFAQQVNASDLQFIWPPFLLDHAVAGLLLLPLGATTWYAGHGIARQMQWGYRIGIINAITVLMLPVMLVLVMDKRYFAAIPFVIASVLVTLVGLSMLWPLLWVRKDIRR